MMGQLEGQAEAISGEFNLQDVGFEDAGILTSALAARQRFDMRVQDNCRDLGAIEFVGASHFLECTA